jgi:hypothetical protein
LQNQRSQRPLAALILKWLGNSHGPRTTFASGKNLASRSHFRLSLKRGQFILPFV